MLCEVWNVNDTPHEKNTRRRLEETISDVDDIQEWVGFEQEYTLFQNGKPLDAKIGEEPNHKEITIVVETLVITFQGNI